MRVLSDFLTACLEIHNSDGSVTWQPVDLDSHSTEGNFQVFNTYTGSHESFNTLAGAKGKWDELKEKITNDYLTSTQSSTVNFEHPPSPFEVLPVNFVDETPPKLEIL